ncbi:MAG: tRNA (adenosine(37)-N6)-threonylcarbamoyltransferase complex dimerization subunit type 1 TsaB [Chitinophagaceae bacterium]
MALILNIDTATSLGSVSLSFEGILIDQRINTTAVDHATWIHVAIEEICNSNNHLYSLKDLDAIAIVAGPGSYTGLRVGMATAKGFCYALNSRLISLNTLNVMAYATNKEISPSQLLCPMLDARRMEVFTALYNAELKELIEPGAMILEADSFNDWLQKNEIVFFGSGSYKWKELVQHDNAVFIESFYTPQDIAFVSYHEFRQETFSDLAYAEPVYLKDFYTPKRLMG